MPMPSPGNSPLPDNSLPMKLLLTNDELHEVNGGTQLFIGELARELLNRGHEVAVYSWLAGSVAD